MGSSYGTASSYGTSGYAVQRYSPSTAAATIPKVSSQVQASPSSTKTEMAWLRVKVPAQAVVHIDDFRTKSLGTSRRYGWKTLQPGQVVKCKVRATILSNGEEIEQVKEAELRSGAVATLVFDLRPLETSLTLRVPADAKVYLGNREKTRTGEVRTFRSMKLAAGAKVTDYPVRVSVVRNGRSITQERRISLTAGESKSMEFDFGDDASVAALARPTEASRTN